MQIDLRNYEFAIHDCNKAIELNQKWVKAYTRKAAALREQVEDPRSNEKCIEVLSNALTIAMEDADG